MQASKEEITNSNIDDTKLTIAHGPPSLCTKADGSKSLNSKPMKKNNNKNV